MFVYLVGVLGNPLYAKAAYCYIKKIIIHLKERGIGILITDHNVRETLDVCEHAYIVSHGEIIAEGDADQILANQKVRDVYMASNSRYSYSYTECFNLKFKVNNL